MGDSLSVEAETGIDKVYLIDWKEDHCSFTQSQNNEPMFVVGRELAVLLVVELDHGIITSVCMLVPDLNIVLWRDCFAKAN